MPDGTLLLQKRVKQVSHQEVGDITHAPSVVARGNLNYGTYAIEKGAKMNNEHSPSSLITA